jgi:hypothetical protein
MNTSPGWKLIHSTLATLARALVPITTVGVVVCSTAGRSHAQSQLVFWGNCLGGQCNAPAAPPGLSYVQVAAGLWHTIALRSDGTIEGWGDNQYGQCDVPALPPGLSYVEVEAGIWHTVARRSDGSVIAWGANFYGQCNVPVLPPGVLFTQVDAAGNTSVARLSDGSAVGWGNNIYGQCDIPPPQPGNPYAEVATGAGTIVFPGFVGHTVARRADGSLIAVGRNNYGQCDVPALPPGLAYVEVSAGYAHTVARRSDGSVVAWGNNDSGQCNVPLLPSGVSYVDIDADGTFTIARRSDGSTVVWGGMSNVPQPPAGSFYADFDTGGQWVAAILVRTPFCGSAALYCSPAATNSVSPYGARFTVDGCPGLEANNMVFSVSGLPPNTIGLFYYGSQPIHNSYGNGWTCVGGSIRRVGPAIAANTNGNVMYPVDLQQVPFTGSPQAILPGSAWNFQFYYRDRAGSPATFNFSEAQHIVFAP